MSNQASQTAFGPMVAVAVEQYIPEAQRLVRDEIAHKFLPFGLQCVVKLAQWSVTRKFLFTLSEKRAPGVWGGVLCRKRYVDEKVLEALNSGIDSVVNLGAGLDTRGYRLLALATIPIFEIDLLENIEYKKDKLQRMYGKIPAHVRLVPIDLSCQELASVLPTYGYQKEHKSFFIWEAVTQYLPETAVRKTFDFLAQVPVGSRMVFTYIRQDFIDGTAQYGLETLYQGFRVKEQWWHFGFVPEQLAAFLQEYSWKELEQVGSQEYTARYLKPCGRSIPVMEIERAVYAEKV